MSLAQPHDARVFDQIMKGRTPASGYCFCDRLLQSDGTCRMGCRPFAPASTKNSQDQSCKNK